MNDTMTEEVTVATMEEPEEEEEGHGAAILVAQVC